MQTPKIIDACRDGNIVLLKELIKNGENINIQNKIGNTPLYIAVLYGSIECVKELLKSGSVLDTINDSGESPIHYACTCPFGFVSICYLLIAGADPNIQDHNGSTPLHYVCNTKNSIGIKNLLLAGGDLTIRNNNGETPQVPENVLQEIGDLETAHRKWLESLPPDCGAVKNYLKNIPGRRVKAAK